MTINRNNYELFAVDFLEGKLTPADTASFCEFLNQNADIAEEFEQINRFTALKPAISKLPDFKYLLKDYNTLEITENNFEEMCIAYYEGDLSAKSQEKLIAYIGKNNQLKSKFDLYKKIRIEPDTSVTYDDKSTLKQKAAGVRSVRRIILISSFAAAASLATLFLLRYQPDNESQTQFVQFNNAQNRIISNSSSGNSENSHKSVKINIPVAESRLVNRINDENSETLIAVVDTSNTGTNDDIKISMIEPKQIENTLYFTEVKVNIKPYNLTTPVLEPAKIEVIKETGTNLYAKATQITANEIIQTGIKGINSMVEGDLAFESQTDNKGRIVEFALSSESFNIKRKLRNN